MNGAGPRSAAPAASYQFVTSLVTNSRAGRKRGGGVTGGATSGAPKGLRTRRDLRFIYAVAERTKKKSAPAAGAAKKTLPAALAKRVEAEVAAKQARTAEAARADIDLILRRRERIAEDFYDIGEALSRLKRPGVAEALGRSSFREICEKDLSMSHTVASTLVDIVSGLPRREAVQLGQERALALVSLAKVTSEHDTAAQLARGKRKLPSGKELDLRKASANEIKAAAKELRAAKNTSARPRGRTTTAEERAHAARLEAALHAAGLKRARVTAVATKPGQEADLRIERVPVSGMKALRDALASR